MIEHEQQRRARPDADRAVFVSALILAGSGSIIFIARTAFSIQGRICFSLFDDAMISMRYARNLAAGAGLVWNAGQPPVEGYTNFLWTVFMAALHLLPIPIEWLSLLVSLFGAACLMANLFIVRRIAVALSGGSAAVSAVATILTALSYPLAFWTLRGMEVGALTLAIDFVILQVLLVADGGGRRQVISLAGATAAALLLRPDAIVPLIAIAGAALCVPSKTDRVRVVATILLTVAVIGTAHTLFRLAYYGRPLPNTFYLKMTGAPLSARIWRGANTFGDVLRHHFAVALIAASLAWRRIRDDWRCRLLAGVFAGQCAYSVLVGGDAWEFFQYANRFVAIATPALFVLVGLGVSRALGPDADVVDDLARGALAVGVLVLLFGSAGFGVEPPLIGSFSLFRLCTGGGLIVLAILALGFKRGMHRWRATLQPAIERRPMMIAIALALLVCASLNSHAVARWALYNAYQVDEDARMSKLGFQLGAGTRDDASIAVVLAGAVPYFSNRPAVDILGKNDTTIANMRTGSEIFPGHDKIDLTYSIGRLRPDAIVFWGGNSDLATDAYVRSLGYRALLVGVYGLSDSPRVYRSAFAIDWRLTK